MEVHVSLPAGRGRGDLSARIYRQLRDAVLDGRLRPGERLPPTRELAARLAVSRNTVAAAYDRLTAEGLLVGRIGAGTYVCAEPLAGPATGRSVPDGDGPDGGVLAPRPRWDGLAARVSGPRGTAEYDFDVGIPDSRLFPFATWRRLVTRQLTQTAQPLAGYGDPAGHPGLRAAIARYVGLSRSVRAGADDVVVTRGAQQALDLVGRVLLDPGDIVAVEDPGYPPARNLFRSLGARVVGVPVDAEGLVVDALPARARLVYTTPSHQFPLGTPMSLGRRAALLGWAERTGAAVVEDDYDSEYRFSDRPLEPLQSLDRGGRVVYVGSFSKTMLPMLRLGFLVAPASLLPALRAARHLSDRHGDLPGQAALARFLDEGLLFRHLRKASREYAGRHARIVAGLGGDLARWLEPVPSAAGLHLCTRLRPGVRVDLDALIARARERDVVVSSIGEFSDAPVDPDGLVIGYGAVRPERIEEGLRRLATIFRELAEPAQRL